MSPTPFDSLTAVSTTNPTISETTVLIFFQPLDIKFSNLSYAADNFLNTSSYFLTSTVSILVSVLVNRLVFVSRSSNIFLEISVTDFSFLTKSIFLDFARSLIFSFKVFIGSVLTFGSIGTSTFGISKDFFKSGISTCGVNGLDNIDLYKLPNDFLIVLNGLCNTSPNLRGTVSNIFGVSENIFLKLFLAGLNPSSKIFSSFFENTFCNASVKCVANIVPAIAEMPENVEVIADSLDSTESSAAFPMPDISSIPLVIIVESALLPTSLNISKLTPDVTDIKLLFIDFDFFDTDLSRESNDSFVLFLFFVIVSETSFDIFLIFSPALFTSALAVLKTLPNEIDLIFSEIESTNPFAFLPTNHSAIPEPIN